MKLKDKVAVITGAASGIGAACAHRFAHEGVRGLVLADVQSDLLQSVAHEINTRHGRSAAAPLAIAQRCDVTREGDIQALVTAGEKAFGPVDVFFSNAGLIRDGHEETPDETWTLNWNVHVMSHVWAARAVLPDMIRRGEGYLLSTASAAGLLTSLPSATYAVTKHAAIAFAESMAIKHASHGIRVSVLCPQAVDTPLSQARATTGGAASRLDGVVSAQATADDVVKAMDSEQFLILPHPEVLTYFQRKANDYDRWLGGMRRLQDKLHSR